MQSHPLLTTSLLALSVGALGCETAADAFSSEQQTEDLLDNIGFVANESTLQEMIGDPVAGQTLILELDPSTPPFTVDSIQESTIPQVLESAIATPAELIAVLNPSGPMDPDVMTDAMVEQISDQVHNALLQMLNDSWGDLADTGSEPFDEDWCWGTADYTLEVKAFDGISFDIESVTFAFNDDDDTIDIHVELADVAVAPSIYIDVDLDTSYADLCPDVGDTVTNTIPVTLGSLDLDMQIQFSTVDDELCHSWGSTWSGDSGCDPLAQMRMGLTAMTIENVNKDLPTLEFSVFEIDFDMDDAMSNSDVEDLLNEAIAGMFADDDGFIEFDTIPLEISPVLITAIEIEDGALEVSHLFDIDGDGMYSVDPCLDSATSISDFDGDQLCNDNCKFDYNPTQSDIDSDGLGDACDDCDAENIGDLEEKCLDVMGDEYCYAAGDGVDDACDNCPDDMNSDQADNDGDSQGDVCDDDDDNDGIDDLEDSCPLDAAGWYKESKPYSYYYSWTFGHADADGDGIGNECDNCPKLASQNTSDRDGDGLGDPCDDDLDGDGIANDDDNCFDVSNPLQSDVDGDLTGDHCDPDPSCNPDEMEDPCNWPEFFFIDGLPIIMECIGIDCMALLTESEVDGLVRRISRSRTTQQMQIVRILGAYAYDDPTARRAIESLQRSTRSRAVYNATVEAKSWFDRGVVMHRLGDGGWADLYEESAMATFDTEWHDDRDR